MLPLSIGEGPMPEDAKDAFSLIFPHFSWRGMFFVGTLPALLVLFIRLRVSESPV